MPQFGIAAWCIDAAGEDGDVFGVAKRHGLATVHLAIGTPEDVARLASPSWRGHVRRRCYETGVCVSCLALNVIESMAIFGPRRDEQSRRGFVAVFHAALDFVVELGVPLIYIPSFGNAEIVSENGLIEAAELLRSLAQSASAMQINVASENSLGPAETERLIDLVALDNFKILFDIFNPLRWGHSPMELVATCFESFADQIHVKDGRLPGYGNTSLGSGDGRVEHVVRGLMRHGFGGTFVLENQYDGPWGLDIKADIATLRAICGSCDVMHRFADSELE